MEDIKKEFPACFPDDFAENILPHNLPDVELDVFRVCTNGTINKASFYSSYEEYCLGSKPFPRNWDEVKHDPSHYSVSCYDDKKKANNTLKCLVGYNPEAFLIQGTASSAMGPMQRTVDRKPGYNKAHIDWWLYAESDPSSQFTKVINANEAREGEKSE